MKQIIKLIAENIDGRGTIQRTMILLEGKQELTDEIILRTENAIKKYKEENNGDRDIDSITDVVCKYLETEGYKWDYVGEDAIIEF